MHDLEYESVIGHAFASNVSPRMQSLDPSTPTAIIIPAPTSSTHFQQSLLLSNMPQMNISSDKDQLGNVFDNLEEEVQPSQKRLRNPSAKKQGHSGALVQSQQVAPLS